MLRYFFLAALFFSYSSYATNYLGRLGAGVSGQLANNLPAMSFKLQTSRRTAYGAIIGIDSNSNRSLYGFAVRAYRILFEEPQLHFYLAGTAGLLNYEMAQTGGQMETDSAYQVDASFGSEFSFRGIESVALSFEFGLSLNNVGGATSFETLGQNFVEAAAHFYF